MIIQTKYLGEVEISEEQILHFPKGVLGFENHYDFVILDIFENHHFKILQSLKHPEIAFFIINPWDFFNDYEVDIPDEELAKIVRCKYSVQVAGNTVEETFDFYISPDGNKCYGKKGI